MHLPFWLSVTLLAPLLVWQGKQTRRTTPRLPEAGGEPHGQYGDGEPALQLLVIGESTAAGVGVKHHQDGLASQLARQLQQQGLHTIGWHSHGINGIRLQALLDNLKTIELPEADTILLSMGVNDTAGLTPRRCYRQQLLALGAQLPGPLYLLSVPPMHRFTALPSPLRQLLGWRARQLDAIQQQLARERPDDFIYLSYPPMNDPALLAEDGYHPGIKGYQAMATALAPALAARLLTWKET
ncbi:MAG: SGNH/GDSL hydrolase family protein [Alcanivorax sp.]|uniref:SGNH/GDSL hydrolase family protein n=1 Tax=Alcanivorax sp. TaxID=1872427 RepID=UPI003DA7837A